MSPDSMPLYCHLVEPLPEKIPLTVGFSLAARILSIGTESWFLIPTVTRFELKVQAGVVEVGACHLVDKMIKAFANMLGGGEA